MLAFDRPQDLDFALNEMRSVDYRQDYLQEQLFPALLKGNWGELDEMVVYQDKKKTIRFSDDVWVFSESDYKGKNVANIYFTIGEEKCENVIMIRQSERHFINQLKCVALAEMWFSGKKIGLLSIKSKINILRNDISQLVKHGITSLEELNHELLEVLVDEGCFDLTKKSVFKGLNALPALSGLLPFKVNFSRLQHKMFNTRPDEAEGKIVIPHRIYFTALNTYSEDVNVAYKLRDEIENAIEDLISFCERELDRKLQEIRNGDSYSPHNGYLLSWKRFTQALEEAGVALVDRCKDPRWMEIYTNLQTTIDVGRKRLDKYTVMFDGSNYSFADFKRYLSKLSAKSAWLCLALSGMRVDELHKISPIYGAQKKTFDRTDYKSDSGKETIYFLTTRQSKITLNSQTKNDTFVTTELGWKAFYVLNAIHTPFRNRFAEGDGHRMFASINNNQYFNPVAKAALGKSIKTHFNKDGFDLTLTAEDMGYLQASDPTQQVFKQGDKFHFTPHQARRSLAYYLIGYELCSFPALKQQLSHLSLAMTRWYARNAHSFEKLYSEIQKERVFQKAEIFARIYQKMSNGKRIAGGKGQSKIAEISREGESYFEAGVNKRKLSTDYWVDQLSSGRDHLHAVAPGMYCTNTQCSMRINIDLTECVGCEYDYIENAVYAESARMDAMRNIEFLKENNELNSSTATKYLMQVKAAEAIMDDLGFSHDKYEFAEDVLSLVIDKTKVA